MDHLMKSKYLEKVNGTVESRVPSFLMYQMFAECSLVFLQLANREAISIIFSFWKMELFLWTRVLYIASATIGRGWLAGREG